jgi:probable blue pigment (indigoidine) exporter
VGAAVGAVVSSALGFALVKRWSPPDDVLVTTSWQLVAGGLLLVPVAAVTEGAPPALDLPAVLALVYLGLVGSALGYVLWFRGLTRMDAGAVAVVGLVNPVVGTSLGVLLLAEPFGPVHLVAVAVTLGSVLVAQAPVRHGLTRLPGLRSRAPRPTVGSCPT